MQSPLLHPGALFELRLALGPAVEGRLLAAPFEEIFIGLHLGIEESPRERAEREGVRAPVLAEGCGQGDRVRADHAPLELCNLSPALSGEDRSEERRVGKECRSRWS